MATPTVRVSEAAHQLLQKLAKQTGQSMVDIMDEALKAYRREVFFQQLNADYAALRADPEASAALDAERKLWDATLMDGLDPNEHWSEKSRRPLPKNKRT